MGIADKIQRVQEKLDKTPVNKATEKERARLKARIAELQEEQQKRQAETGGGYGGYAVKKKGDATVALVGLPSVGKSSLLNTLTNADSEVGAYEFTTLDVVPGMLPYNGANIQILDVPGLIGGAASGKGGGKEVLSVVRIADLVLLMATPEELDGFDTMLSELRDAGIRPNEEPPDVKIERASSGGLSITSTVEQTHLDEDTIRDVLEERGYVNATVTIREDLTLDRLIDAIMDNRSYIPLFRVLNKADTLSDEELADLREEYPDAVFISAETGQNLDELKQRIFDELDLMRIYMKKPGKEPDMDEPLIVERGSTVREVCESLPGDMDETFQDARIWGDSADFDDQKVGADHVLMEGDIVEIRTR